jgi:hypothetical protein
MRMNRIKKTLLIVVITIIGLLILSVISINLPIGHRLVTRLVNNILANKGIPVHITSIRTILPENMAIHGVTLLGPEGDTIIYAEEVQASVTPSALLNKRVILPTVNLGNIMVSFSRNNETVKINIAEAFSKVGKKSVANQGKIKKKWEVSLGEADLSYIRFKMIDSVTGVHITQNIRHLKVIMDKMSLLEKTLAVHSLEIDKATGGIKIDSHSENTKSSSGSGWNIGLAKLALRQVNLVYNNTVGKQVIGIKLGDASAGIDKMDIENKIIDFNKVSVSETSLILRSDIQSNKKNQPGKGSLKAFPWSVSGKGLEFENISLRLETNADSIPKPQNPVFSSITGLSLSLADYKLNNNEVAVEVKKAKLELNNGFSLKEMKGSLGSLSGKTSFILSAETGNSILNLEGSVDRSFFTLLKKPFEIQKANISVSNTALSLKDLLFFKPELKEKSLFLTLDMTPVKVESIINLQDSVLTLSEIKVTQAKNFTFLLEGNIKNCFLPDKAKGEIKYGLSDMNISWLKGILKESGLKKDLPEFTTLSVNGTLSDSLKSPHFTVELLSDLGKINLQGSYDLKHDSFTAKSFFDRVLLGKILANPVLGSFKGSVAIAGNGIKSKAIVADVVVTIDSMRFKDYDYTKMRIECKLRKGNYDLKLVADDPYLKCNLTGLVNTLDSGPEIRAEGSFSAQLNKLHLFKDTLNVEGKMRADFRKKRKLIEAGISLAEIKLSNPDDNAVIHQITASFMADTLRTRLDAVADFFNIKVQLEKSLSELGSILPGYRDYAVSFIHSTIQKTTDRISYLPGMIASIKISPHKAVSTIFQDATVHFSNIDLNFVNSASDDKLHYTLTGNDVKYKKVELGRLYASITDSAGQMSFQVSANNCSLFSRTINKLLLTTRYADGRGTTDLTIFAKPDTVLYNFNISSLIDSNNISLTIPSKQLTMNGVRWQMDTPELLSFNRTAKKVLPSLRMNSNNSTLHILSDTKGDSNVYKFDMANVEFASILPVSMISGNPAGTISGHVDYTLKTNKGKEINSDLKLINVKWSDISFSTLTINGKYKSETQKDYFVEMNAGLDSSKIAVKAVKPASGKRDINAVFSNISIKSFQPFVKKIVSDLKGHISGNLNIVSTNDVENFKGELNINKANMRIKFLNSNFRIPDERILFDGRKVIFDRIRVLDSLDNELTVDGSLDFSKPNAILTDIDVSSLKWQIMNTTEKENSSLFGKIFIDSRLSLNGPLISPELKGKILLTGGTEIFFKQKEDLKLSESEKVVTFVSANSAIREKKLRSDAKKSINTKASVNAILQIDPDTKINVNLSKKMFNISLMIKGGGELNYNMLANKEANLAGKYELSEGNADVKITGWPNKEFRITRGGYARWDGKLEDPELNFEAVNRVRSTYTNPVDNKEHTVDFNVTLKLANRLSRLDVLFTINTPDQYLMSIINTLSPDEQMRQAITILLFEKIDLPGISTSSNYMTEQVNQLVASQLNSLTKTTIHGIDISFGIDSYVQSTSSGGQQTKTSLSYEVKKALLNNRAQIEVSGRINDANKQQGASELSLNNLSFEYRLDSAGTKFLKVYNEHTYEDVFEGEVIKTGIGIIYRKSYPKLSDIWRKDEKNMKLKNGEK